MCSANSFALSSLSMMNSRCEDQESLPALCGRNVCRGVDWLMCWVVVHQPNRFYFRDNRHIHYEFLSRRSHISTYCESHLRKHVSPSFIQNSK